jgi:hypothetical protein
MEPYIAEKIKEFEDKFDHVIPAIMMGDITKDNLKEVYLTGIKEAYQKGQEEKEKEIRELEEEERRKFLEGFSYKAQEK